MRLLSPICGADMRVRKFVMPGIITILALSNLYLAYRLLDAADWRSDMASHQQQLEQRSDLSVQLLNSLHDCLTSDAVGAFARRAEAEGHVVKSEGDTLEIDDFNFKMVDGRVQNVSVHDLLLH